MKLEIVLSCHLLNHYDVITPMGCPVWMKFGSLMLKSMPINGDMVKIHCVSKTRQLWQDVSTSTDSQCRIQGHDTI